MKEQESSHLEPCPQTIDEGEEKASLEMSEPPDNPQLSHSSSEDRPGVDLLIPN